MISTQGAQNKTIPPNVTLNLEDAIERMGDREIYLEIAHFFASHLQESLKALSLALNSGDAVEATRLAHSLKGNCATVGADELRDQCLQMERLCRDGDLDKAHVLYAELSPKLLALRDILMAL
jgi:FOG: HPt domain